MERELKKDNEIAERERFKDRIVCWYCLVGD
jgi:hypothetical protein